MEIRIRLTPTDLQKLIREATSGAGFAPSQLVFDDNDPAGEEYIEDVAVTVIYRDLTVEEAGGFLRRVSIFPPEGATDGQA